MNIVISCDDSRFEAFLQRLPACVGEVQRVNITPETVPTPTPWWWRAAPNRWALKCAIVSSLQIALSAGENLHLFEDDCIFAEDFAARYADFYENLPENWDMAYLGGQLLATELYPPRPVGGNEHVIEVQNAHRNHAWIARNSSLQRILEWLETPVWNSTHTTDWRLGYLHLQSDFHVYIPATDWMCGQAGGLSSLDGITYPERWWPLDPERRAAENARLAEAHAARQSASTSAQES